MLVGVISDTHGSINHYALTALQGVSLILHAGDIGKPAVIDALEEIAPVTAVYGNVDVGTPLARQFPSVQGVLLEDVRVYMTHVGGRPDMLACSLPEPRPDVYIFGHSHVALLEIYRDVLFLNPGAAGRPRFGGGLSVALLELKNGKAAARIVPLGAG